MADLHRQTTEETDRLLDETTALKNLCVSIDDWLRILAQPVLLDSLSTIFENRKREHTSC